MVARGLTLQKGDGYVYVGVQMVCSVSVSVKANNFLLDAL